MYKSPVTIIESAIQNIMEEREGAIAAKIQSDFAVDVDKSELIRALQYDRGQYDKGYADGKADAMADLVRCRDCWKSGAGMCSYKFKNVPGKDFCGDGERRSGEDLSENTKTTKTVKHGYWEQGDMYDVGDVCSECDFDSGIDNCHLPECPGCGAIMGGEDYTDYEMYGMRLPDTISNEEVASRLIANGVTVQRWIPSSKRAPTEKDADRNGCVLARTLVNTNTTTDFKHVCNDSEFYPYWMPLPEPPKGE